MITAVRPPSFALILDCSVGRLLPALGVLRFNGLFAQFLSERRRCASSCFPQCRQCHCFPASG